jgi:hypothetical protein
VIDVGDDERERPAVRSGFAHLDAEPLEEALPRRQSSQRIVPGRRSDALSLVAGDHANHRDGRPIPGAGGAAQRRFDVDDAAVAGQKRDFRGVVPSGGNERAVEKNRRAGGAPDDVGGRPACELLHPAVEPDDRSLTVHEKRSFVRRVVPHRPPRQSPDL